MATLSEVTLASLASIEMQILSAYKRVEPFYCYNTFGLQDQIEVYGEDMIRAAAKLLVARGLLKVCKGLRDEEGQLCGTGWGLTDEGRKFVKENL